MDYSFLKNKSANEASTPWQHFIIDNFLPDKEFKSIQDCLCSVKSGFSQLDDDSFEVNYMFVPNLEIANFFLSDEFNTFLEKTVKGKLAITETGLVQLRMMNGDSPAMPAHVDSADKRSLVCLYYLSPNWTNSCGGELLLHHSEAQIDRKESLVIEPQANRMVMFYTDENNWHSVTKVHDWNRFSILTEWIVQD